MKNELLFFNFLHHWESFFKGFVEFASDPCRALKLINNMNSFAKKKNLSSKFKFIFISVYIHVCMCIPAHVCSIALGGCKTASDPQELELKLMVRGLMWVLETEFWSSGRAAMILKLSCQAPTYLSFKIFLLGSVFGNVGFVYIILALFCFVLQMYCRVFCEIVSYSPRTLSSVVSVALSNFSFLNL